MELLRAAHDQVRWSNSLRRDLPLPCAVRMARVLVGLVDNHGHRTPAGWTLGFPLTKVELASIGGMKPRTAEKAFSELRDSGMVIGLRAKVLVPDLDRLRRYSTAAVVSRST